MSKTITLLGSTGSIGTQSLDVARMHGYRVFGLAAHASVEKLLAQIEEFHPRCVAVADPEACSRLEAMLAGRADAPRLLKGAEGIRTLAAMDGPDVVLNAVVGIAGLGATLAALEEGKPVSSLHLEPEVLKEDQFLTAKPVLYVGNNSEKRNAENAAKVAAYAKETGAGFVELCVKFEADIAEFSEEEKKAFLAETGNDYTGLEKVVREGMKLLNLCTYFTAGSEVEVRSWLIPVGCTAPQAAGKIHSDFEKGFIRADVYTFDDLVKYGDEKALREHGLIRSEGKDYIVKDGDVCLFKINA